MTRLVPAALFLAQASPGAKIFSFDPKATIIQYWDPEVEVSGLSVGSGTGARRSGTLGTLHTLQGRMRIIGGRVWNV